MRRCSRSCSLAALALVLGSACESTTRGGGGGGGSTLDAGFEDDAGLPVDGGGGPVDTGVTGGDAPPRAVASVDLMSGTAPLVAQFTGSASTDPDGDLVNFLWDFGDGSARAIDADVAHTFVEPGSYTVTFTVFDLGGRSDSTTLSVEVRAPPPPPPMRRPPVAAITANPTSGVAPVTVVLDGSGSTDPDNDIESYIWIFGDGSSTATGPMVTHTFQSPGRFNTQLIVTDRTGQTGVATVLIEATRDPALAEPPVARATGTPTSGNAPLVVRFSGAGSSDPDNDIVRYSWSFGDGSAAVEGVTPQHIYQTPGSFVATLTVTDATMRSSTAMVPITVAMGPPAGSCPSASSGTSVGTLSAQFLAEVSGLVVSRQNPGVFWVHNDSGDANRIYAITESGTVLGAYTLVGAQAVDWEDIAIGPGPVAGVDYLYVGDIGDNGASSNVAPVYRVREPSVSTSQTPAIFELQGVDTIGLFYPNNEAHNSETLLVDPITGDLFIVTKDAAGTSVLFKAPAPLVPNTRITLTRAGVIQLPGRTTSDVFATAGDISQAGDLIVLRTYNRAYAWRRAAGQSVEATMLGNRCTITVRSEPQGESIGLAPDGRSYFTVSEGTGQPLYRYTLQ